MRTLTLISLLLVSACAAHVDSSPAGLRANACDVDEDLRLDESGAITHGISQCAICARLEAAYVRTAERLGCDAPYPLDGCPLDEGLTDCLVWQVEDTGVLFFEESPDCDTLEQRAGIRNNYTGFECGDSCQWSDGHVRAGVTSTVEQPDPLPLGREPSEHFACAPGTPYHER